MPSDHNGYSYSHGPVVVQSHLVSAPLGQVFPNGEAVRLSDKDTVSVPQTMVELQSGDVVGGFDDGSLRRWQQPWQPSKPSYSKIKSPFNSARDSEFSVKSLAEMSNGDLITAHTTLVPAERRHGNVANKSVLQRWRHWRPFGKSIPVGTSDASVVETLLPLRSGSLVGKIKVESEGVSLHRWVFPDVSVRNACQELKRDSALLAPQSLAEKAAQRTCGQLGHL